MSITRGDGASRRDDSKQESFLSFPLGAVLNFMSTSRMQEHALHKSNRISEYPRPRNVKM